MWPHSYQSCLPSGGTKQSWEKPPLLRSLGGRLVAGSLQEHKAAKEMGPLEQPYGLLVGEQAREGRSSPMATLHIGCSHSSECLAGSYRASQGVKMGEGL